MFKDKKFQTKNLTEIFSDIDETAEMFPGVQEVFLADGDAIAMPTEDLLAITFRLKEKFKHLSSIATYAGPKSTLAKSPDELKLLCDAGITKAYLGVESGDDRVLRETCKGVNAEEMQCAGTSIVQSGIKLCAIILIGLAGRSKSLENADATAAIINKIKPAELAAMTYTPVPGTRMYRQIQNGEFEVLDSKGVLIETRELVSKLNVCNLHFTSNHVSNPVSASCVLPKDKDALMDALDESIKNAVDGQTRRTMYL
jgi:radical SAM superfamily enzyme YgiQ (UPF0313 family)